MSQLPNMAMACRSGAGRLYFKFLMARQPLPIVGACDTDDFVWPMSGGLSLSGKMVTSTKLSVQRLEIARDAC